MLFLFLAELGTEFGFAANSGLGLQETLRPLKIRRFTRVVAFEMAREARRGLSVGEFGFAKDFATEVGESRIVGDEFFAGVDVVVVMVRRAVVVEPGLHAFGEVYGD